MVAEGMLADVLDLLDLEAAELEVYEIPEEVIEPLPEEGTSVTEG
jgi:hypothetical protein